MFYPISARVTMTLYTQEANITAETPTASFHGETRYQLTRQPRPVTSSQTDTIKASIVAVPSRQPAG